MDNRNNTMSHLHSNGDLVVGSADPSKSVYTTNGAKIAEETSHVVGDPAALAEQRKAMANIARQMGGKVVTPVVAAPTPTKKGGKKPKVKQQEHPSPDPLDWMTPPEPVEPPIVLQTVQFENGFGRMKMKVEQFIDHESAVMLVFSDEDSVLFEPKPGEQLILHTPHRDSYPVYYPGVTFSPTYTEKKFMILFKVAEEPAE